MHLWFMVAGTLEEAEVMHGKDSGSGTRKSRWLWQTATAVMASHKYCMITVTHERAISSIGE
jgi:hypothetical protein